jgi:hypothetical protein
MGVRQNGRLTGESERALGAKSNSRSGRLSHIRSPKCNWPQDEPPGAISFLALSVALRGGSELLTQKSPGDWPGLRSRLEVGCLHLGLALVGGRIPHPACFIDSSFYMTGTH